MTEPRRTELLLPMRTVLLVAATTENPSFEVNSALLSRMQIYELEALTDEGLREIVLKGAFYYRKAVRQPGLLDKYGKGTPNDWIERHVFGHRTWIGILVMLVIDIYLFGFFVGPIVWGVQMIWIPFWAAGIVNGVGHAMGYRNFEVKDASRNISPIAIWLGGEELHNNHHADPHSAKFKARWFELDVGWLYIRRAEANERDFASLVEEVER